MTRLKRVLQGLAVYHVIVLALMLVVCVVTGSGRDWTDLLNMAFVMGGTWIVLGLRLRETRGVRD